MDNTLSFSTLDVLESPTMRDQDFYPASHFQRDAARTHRIYNEVLDTCGINNAPPLIFAQLEWSQNPEAGGRAAEYHPQRHAITIDSAIIQHFDRPELEALIAHELSHALTIGHRAHGSEQRAAERQLIDWLNQRDDREPVDQLPQQTGWTPRTKRVAHAWAWALGFMVTAAIITIQFF